MISKALPECMAGNTPPDVAGDWLLIRNPMVLLTHQGWGKFDEGGLPGFPGVEEPRNSDDPFHQVCAWLRLYGPLNKLRSVFLEFVEVLK